MPKICISNHRTKAYTIDDLSICYQDMLEIRKNISLRPFTTFAVEATADYFVELHDEQEIYDLISEPIFQTHPHLLL